MSIPTLKLMYGQPISKHSRIDQVSTAHSALEVEKEAPKDIDLSINNNLSDFDDYHGLMSHGKEAMVVDAANGSLMEDKAFDTPVQK